MQKIGPPDSFHLRAAIGWLELGNPGEAGEELARVKPDLLEHPDVLEIRWSVCAATGSWDAALPVADAILAAAPERSSGWLHRAYALRRIRGGGLKAAWTALRPAFEKFPRDPLIAFNLACYAAQDARLDEAWEWLHKAMESAGDIKKIKEMALGDKDLEALWDRIREL